MIPEKLIEAVKQNRSRTDEETEKTIIRKKQEAWKEVERLSEEFQKADPCLERIILFGSLARDNVKRPDFDIDLSFEGVEYYLCAAIALDSPFKVDLVDYRNARDYIKEEIDKYGKVIYDSKALGCSYPSCAPGKRV